MSTFEHSDYCIGIDLGTTNSAIAMCSLRDGKIKSIPTKIRRIVNSNSDRDDTEQAFVLPSCVYYRKGMNGEYTPTVGDFARRYYSVRPELVAKSIKLQMGETQIVYPEWDEKIPDKRPDDVSARILEHLIKDFKRQKRIDTLEDVVITVPASFSIEKRHATLLAAEKAGIAVRDENGKFRNDILLSEPEAVMYQLINDIQNSEDDIELDFGTKKNVMIFDIGGGTLDITVHEVHRLDDSNIISLKCLGTDKYTPIAGDTFDKLLVDYIYDAYISYWERQSEEIAKTLKNDKSLKAKLLKVAEDLKINISDNYDADADELFDFSVSINNGHVYDGDITKEEFEECLEPLMGRNLSYNDYKKVDTITDKNNIIYPILCVLKQVAQKLGDDFKLDAVVLNGGMSKLYMIDERLTEFFGFKTLTVSDPDLSVAKGASIWHYYLHQQQNSERMKKLHFEYMPDDDENNTESSISQNPAAADTGKAITGNFIVSDNAILPEAIYFGLKGGVTQVIAEDGAELPLTSTSVRGKLAKDQKELYISIMQKLDENSFKQIASGIIKLKKNYFKDVFATLRCSISKEQIITIEADICSDEFDTNLLERSDAAEIVLGEINENGKGIKLIPPDGAKLNVKNEMDTFITLCNNLNKAKKERNKQKKNSYPKDIINISNIIKSAGNPQDFAEDVIKTLTGAKNNDILYNLLPIASTLAIHWNEADRIKLLKATKSILKSAEVKYSFGPVNDTLYIAIINRAIQLIGNIGTEEYADYIKIFLNRPQHKIYVLCAFSNIGVNYELIYDEFMKFKYGDSFSFGIFWAVGNCFKRTNTDDYKVSESKIAKKLIEHITSGILKPKELACAETSLGLICDQRPIAHNPVSPEIADMALSTLEQISDYYDNDVVTFQSNANGIAKNLIEGINLSINDEVMLKKYTTNLLFDEEIEQED